MYAGGHRPIIHTVAGGGTASVTVVATTTASHASTTTNVTTNVTNAAANAPTVADTANTVASLPYTGAAILVTLVVGAALIAAGLFVLGAIKRRQRG